MNTMLCPIIINSNTIEPTVHTSCYLGGLTYSVLLICNTFEVVQIFIFGVLESKYLTGL